MNSLADRLRRTLLTGAAFVVFFFGGLVLSYLILPLIFLGRATRFEKAQRCRRFVSRAWLLFHDFLRVVGVLRCDPRTFQLELPSGAFVLVANHPTLLDVTALIAAIPDLVVVAKPAMFRNPLVGRLLRYCNHIQSGEGAFAGGAVLLQALDRLSAGTPVLIFPEGTRSPARGVGAVHSGAFNLAARSGLPVLVAFLRCEPPTLLRGEPWYAIPSRAPDLTLKQLPTMRVLPGEAREAARRLQDRYLELASEPATGEPEARLAPPSFIETRNLHGRA